MHRYFIIVSLICVAAAAADEKPLKARAALSYHGTGGNTKNHGVATSGEAEYARGRWVIDGNGAYTMSASAGKKTGESAALGAGLKYFVTASERVYGRYKAEWRRNVFSGFEYRVYNFAGLGAYLVKTVPQELSVEAGPSYINERYRDDEKKPASFAAAHVGADYQVYLNGSTEVDVSVVWDMDLKNTSEQLLTGSATLRVALAEWLALTATENIDWDNVPPEGFGQLDVKTTVGLALENY